MLSGRSPRPVSGSATHTASGPILTVLIYNSRLPSSTLLIDWMALTIKFNITCCSCTRSHRMRGNSPASCVPTVTPVLTASLPVRAVTSRIAALRSTTSFRGGAFLMRDPIRSTTSLARSVSLTQCRRAPPSPSPHRVGFCLKTAVQQRRLCVPPQWAGLASEPVQRPLVRRTAIKFPDRMGEFRIGRHRAEQGHRRAEFQVVGGSEDFPNGSALDRIDKRRALAKPASQDTVAEIEHGFLPRGDGKSPRHRAVAEACELRKIEPDPVTLLLALTKFRENAPLDRSMRIDKALQIEGVGHPRLIPDWPKSSASLSRKGRWPSSILS